MTFSWNPYQMILKQIRRHQRRAGRHDPRTRRPFRGNQSNGCRGCLIGMQDYKLKYLMKHDYN